MTICVDELWTVAEFIGPRVICHIPENALDPPVCSWWFPVTQFHGLATAEHNYHSAVVVAATTTAVTPRHNPVSYTRLVNSCPHAATMDRKLITHKLGCVLDAVLSIYVLSQIEWGSTVTHIWYVYLSTGHEPQDMGNSRVFVTNIVWTLASFFIFSSRRGWSPCPPPNYHSCI